MIKIEEIENSNLEDLNNNEVVDYDTRNIFNDLVLKVKLIKINLPVIKLFFFGR
jgi:hypothetical protein